MPTINGVIPAKVVSDPDELGRVRVRMEMLGGTSQSYWAPVATLMSGPGRGSWYMPLIGDDVLVAFENGNADMPYVIGAMWNGEDRPPVTDPELHVIRSPNGHEITIYDPAIQSGDAGYVCIKDRHGNSITLANASITIEGKGAILINAPSVRINGRAVLLAPNGF